jgi:hypothetical protein
MLRSEKRIHTTREQRARCWFDYLADGRSGSTVEYGRPARRQIVVNVTL